jgi:hypothetical protein
MNIFVLDPDAVTAAHMMCDKHVVKMILESCQLLSTAHHVLDGEPVMTKGKKKEYKTFSNGNMSICRCTMINHPCTIWTRETRANYLWLWKHAYSLCKEYTRRYGKVHVMEKMLMDELYDPPANITKGKLTPFAQAMPDQYRNSDAVIAYRNYYINEKARFAKWKNCEVPEWFALKQPDFLLYADLPF